MKTENENKIPRLDPSFLTLKTHWPHSIPYDPSDTEMVGRASSRAGDPGCFPNQQSEIRNQQLTSFRQYLLHHARVPLRDTRHGAYGPFTFTGRAPLDFIVTLIDKILANCLHGQTVEIGGTSSMSPTKFAPHTLKGSTITVGGGAQFGKTVLILNFQAFATFVKFINFGYYTPDQELLAKIVDTKFRPDVIDQQPWMAEMVQLGKAENASGKSVDRKNSYQVSQGGRKSFGHFCGMQKPPTTISLDAAALDEVDDIPSQNMGYVDGRMTGSRLQLKFEIGTQRIAGAGQNARLKAGTFHVMMYECPHCRMSWNLEDEFPRCIRVKQPARAALVTGGAELPLRPNISPNVAPLETSISSLQSNPSHASYASHTSHPPNQQSEICNPQSNAPNNPPIHQSTNPLSNSDPILSPESLPNRNALYYCACPNCGTVLDRDSGKYIAKNPHRLAEAHFSIRVSQLNISAISLHEIVSAWHTALADPSGAALTAFYCDRLALPNAGAAQPITPAVLETCRILGLTESADIPQPYDMKFGVPPLGGGNQGTPPNPQSEIRNPQSPDPAADHRPFPGIYPGSTGGNGVPGIHLPGYVTPDHQRATQRARAKGPFGVPPSGGRDTGRFAGLDTGPRCWFWCDERRSPATTACVWAELIASGLAPTRIPLLMRELNITCLFIDAGGEPDLTKRLVLSLNGLDHYTPPNKPRTEILNSRLGNIGNSLTWDPEKARWTNLRAAAVLFVAGEARGIEQTIGFTQEGKIYPLIKCNRAESIQTTVNDFLTPESGVYEYLNGGGRAELPLRPNIGSESRVYAAGEQGKILRTLPRARLPRNCTGPGITLAMLDSHLLNLRKDRDPATGEEHWIDGIENHLALAKVYARLANIVTTNRPPVKVAYSPLPNSPWSKDRIGSMGLGKLKSDFVF